MRVTGPFTVESLSPHRVLSPEEERPASEVEAQRDDTANQFVPMVLDNLKKAGVQNTVASERLTFDRLELVTGRWIQARGEYTDANGAIRRVAVGVRATRLDVASWRVHVERVEGQALALDGILDASLPEVLEDHRLELSLGVVALRLDLGWPGAPRRREDAMRREALDGERAGDAHALGVLVGLVVEQLRCRRAGRWRRRSPSGAPGAASTTPGACACRA